MKILSSADESLRTHLYLSDSSRPPCHPRANPSYSKPTLTIPPGPKQGGDLITPPSGTHQNPRNRKDQVVPRVLIGQKPWLESVRGGVINIVTLLWTRGG